MGRNKIPERAPLADAVSGVIARLASAHLLISPTEAAPSDGEIVASGHFIVRYAVPYLGKPHLSIVPGLVALDYGEMLVGEEAWNFILKRSNLYPRADVIGYRSDGSDEMITIKWLDLALPIQVLIYADATAATPLATLDAVISATDDLPPRLLDYLPRYDTLDKWRTRPD